MYDIERQEKILEILRERKSCSVTELAQILSFSGATIRRDLNLLEKEKKIRKTFGGAVIVENYSTEVPVMIRRKENEAIKRRLCRAVSDLIQDNMTIFIDSSTTTEYVLEYLGKNTGLIVVTNNPDIPARLSGTDITVYCTGGKYLHHTNSYVGEYARNMLRGINADLMIFSARGISMDGKVTVSSTEDDVHKVMMEHAKSTCLLVDSTKMGKTYPFTICDLRDVDIIITDEALPDGLTHLNSVIADK